MWIENCGDENEYKNDLSENDQDILFYIALYLVPH